MDSLVLFGAGGHGKVLLDAARAGGGRVLFCADDDAARAGTVFCGLEVKPAAQLGSFCNCGNVALLNGIGYVGGRNVRAHVHARLTAGGWRFATVCHPAAVIAQDAVLADGVQVLAGAVVAPSVRVGVNSIINHRAVVDHDCVVGEHCHVAPGVTLCGGVRLGSGVFVGAGATVVPGVSIGDGAVIGAGATVLRHVSAGSVVAGTPAIPLAGNV
ncbi:acetyltransferase [Oleidesulfovibrio alaskensis]|jgi:UDP-perosamine 4-acetyltransferase|uniref:acetyltransferase n=1 Tax=Oleidesulfovibrio alaskensis TaxID=58180 RepID=UPI00040C5686|nr:acetyltransferase [Oleidesulfovibrio alaskensis]